MKGVTIKGGCFEQYTELLFFENTKEDKKNNPTNIAVIYGANGSGKSSIANALLHYKNSNDNPPIVELLDKDNKIIDKSKIKLDSLHVFNENFIHVNVRFTEDDKLNAIVLLGEETVKLNEKISKLEEDKNNEQDDLNTHKRDEEGLINSIKYNIQCNNIIDDINSIALDLKNRKIIDGNKEFKRKLKETKIDKEDYQNLFDEINKNNIPIESYNSYQN